jgi:hypothetical protein
MPAEEAVAYPAFPDNTPPQVSDHPVLPVRTPNAKQAVPKTNQPAAPSAPNDDSEVAPPRLASPVEAPAQIQTPAEVPDPAGESASSQPADPVQVSVASVVPHPEAEIAFGARIVERDVEEDTTKPVDDDSFLSSNSQKQTAPSPAPSTSHAEPTASQHEAPAAEKAPSAAPTPHLDQPKSEAVPVLPAQVTPAGSGRPQPVGDTPQPRAAAQLPETQPRTTQPVHDITLRLTSENQQVDVKLVDRGGELHVAVQSADPVLTTDLRASVHDLINGLEKNGLHAETWSPREAVRSDQELPQSQSEQSASGNDQRRQGRDNHQQDDSPPKRSRGSNDEWMKEIDALIGAGKGN